MHFTSAWRHYKLAMMCARKANSRRLRSLCQVNRQAGPTGDCSHYATETLTRRRKDWSARARSLPRTIKSITFWVFSKAAAGGRQKQSLRCAKQSRSTRKTLWQLINSPKRSSGRVVRIANRNTSSSSKRCWKFNLTIWRSCLNWGALRPSAAMLTPCTES